MADAINKQSGILLQKPSRFDVTSTSLETQLVDTFFIGKDHPINYSPEFRKVLKKEYDCDEAVTVEVDLNAGCNDFLEKPGSLSFDLLLDYLLDKRRISKKCLKEIIYGASIVCRRGVLNKLINAPYKNEFQFAVKKFQDIFFIKETSSECYGHQNFRNSADPYYYLPKFKKHIISPYGDESYQPPKEVSTWEQMQGVYFSEFSLTSSNSNSLKIFYGTEIDAFDQNNNVVEIKLQKGDFVSNGYPPYLVDKLRKWYFQSQLVNSDTIVVGFRNNNIVHSIKKIKTHDLSLFLKPEHRWHQFSSYSATITILSSVCKFYEENVKENQTLVIELPPNKSHILYHIRDDIIQNMLPKEFKKAFEDDDVHEATTQPVTKQGHILRTEKAWMDDCIEKACV